jgi:polar amino acid transport system substrate-binding protein
MMHRRSVVWGVAIIALIAISVFAFTACGGGGGSSSSGSATPTSAATTAAPATFTYAASGTYPPFSMVENGKLTGFDIELGQLLAQKMGMTPKAVTNPFETIIEGLNANKYDAVIGSLAITPERQKVVDFTMPYYTSGAQIYVRNDNTTITSAADLRGKKIGVVAASTYLALAQKLTDPSKAISYQSDTIALQDLVAGRVDAMITDQVVGGLAIKKGLAVKPVGTPQETTDQAIAVRKDEADLLKKLNDALTQAKQDGSYKALSMKWLGQVLLSGVQ